MKRNAYINDPDMAGAPMAMYRAGRSALIKAKLHGVPIVTWRDGKVVHVPPEEIVIPPEEPETEQG